MPQPYLILILPYLTLIITQVLDQFQEDKDYFLTDISLLSFVHKHFERRGYDIPSLVELAGLLTHPINTSSRYTLSTPPSHYPLIIATPLASL